MPAHDFVHKGSLSKRPPMAISGSANKIPVPQTVSPVSPKSNKCRIGVDRLPTFLPRESTAMFSRDLDFTRAETIASKKQRETDMLLDGRPISTLMDGWMDNPY